MTRPGVFPFAPLQAALERRLPEISVQQSNGHPMVLAAGDFQRGAEVLGVTPRCLQRWARGQLLSVRAADECATRLGHHPTVIWPDFHELCDELEREAEAVRQASRARRRARRAIGAPRHLHLVTGSR